MWETKFHSIRCVVWPTPRSSYSSNQPGRVDAFLSSLCHSHLVLQSRRQLPTLIPAAARGGSPEVPASCLAHRVHLLKAGRPEIQDIEGPLLGHIPTLLGALSCTFFFSEGKYPNPVSLGPASSFPLANIHHHAAGNSPVCGDWGQKTARGQRERVQRVRHLPCWWPIWVQLLVTQVPPGVIHE